MYLKMKYFGLVGLFLLVFSSCTPLKDLKYLENREVQELEESVSPVFAYRVQPGDNLYVKVFSMDNKSSELFNAGGNQQNLVNSPSSIYLNSFSVNDSGNVQLPMIGGVHVKGKTIDEVRALIEQRVAEFVNHVTVAVKLVNFRVTVLGEVQRPGQFTIYNDKATIFDALGLAGDLTVYGNRKEIKIVRVYENETKIHYIDISDVDVMNSEFYYLLPNDVVYVEPLKSKTFGFATFPIGTILSGISTLILVLNFIK